MTGTHQTNEPTRLQDSAVTLVEGSCFGLCDRLGDIRPGTVDGLFVSDTRVLSGFTLTVDGEATEPLTVSSDEPWRAVFVQRAQPRPGHQDSTLLVRRERFVGRGMREDLTVQNVGGEAASVRIALAVEADFADLFEVKDGRVSGQPAPNVSVGAGVLASTREYRSGEASRGVLVTCQGATVTAAGLELDLVVPARSQWTTTIQVQAVIDGMTLEPYFPSDRPLADTPPARVADAWRRSTSTVVTPDPGLAQVLRRSRVDLGALRIFDPQQPGAVAVAAGAPWFMTLFGRDSLLTSYMSLALDPSLALGTLRMLARLQGARVDPTAEEQPGRILHEVRFGADPGLALGGRRIYYGSVDATPLFVVLVGELRRWGLAREQIEALLPHVDRALEWVERFGDSDGDGFVDYRRHTDRGLANQGWKDSWDGVTFADGRMPRAPIALAEVQGYVYAAYLVRADLARDAGDERGAADWAGKAQSLRERFAERFWLPEQECFALALDASGAPVDAVASNQGHCLWSGIVEPEQAALVARRLLAPDMFSGWGVRTLSAEMAAYNPMSYHNGSVWPHDNALVAAGLMRYGFVDEAQRVADAVLSAAESFDGRLPELFCGFDREELPMPVPFPTSCSPQAWASAAPIQILRTMLRLDPSAPESTVGLAPVLPERFRPLVLSNLALGAERVTIEVPDGERPPVVSGLREITTLRTDPRPVAVLGGPPPG